MLRATVDSVRDSGVRARVMGCEGWPIGCLSENLVIAFVAGHASSRERARIETHLDHCMACAELVFAAAHDRDVTSSPAGMGWPTAFSAGNVLAERFTITRFVARGGMGEVYDAFDRKVPERVALKTVRCTLSDNPTAVHRLCEEVKLARRIAHRHVCRIHELHEHREGGPSGTAVHFLAMEFVEGETLKARIGRGPIPPKLAGRIARQLLEGLAAAHSAGVVHLDFKSQNVMLRAGVSPPEAVIMDFSLARALEEGRLQASDTQRVGSPGYMSPEQLECSPGLGPASDIYSFGIVLFEMLTGRLPFQGDCAASMMAMQLRRPAPPPTQLLPGLTPVFDSFLAKCLARDPRARFSDAGLALPALDRCLARPFDRAARSRQLARRAGRVLFTLAPVALGAGLAILLRPPGVAPNAAPLVEPPAVLVAPATPASSATPRAAESRDEPAALAAKGVVPSSPAASEAQPLTSSPAQQLVAGREDEMIQRGPAPALHGLLEDDATRPSAARRALLTARGRHNADPPAHPRPSPSAPAVSSTAGASEAPVPASAPVPPAPGSNELAAQIESSGWSPQHAPPRLY